jgi:hypothetical protein
MNPLFSIIFCCIIQFIGVSCIHGIETQVVAGTTIPYGRPVNFRIPNLSEKHMSVKLYIEQEMEDGSWAELSPGIEATNIKPMEIKYDIPVGGRKLTWDYSKNHETYRPVSERNYRLLIVYLEPIKKPTVSGIFKFSK